MRMLKDLTKEELEEIRKKVNKESLSGCNQYNMLYVLTPIVMEYLRKPNPDQTKEE